MEQEMLLDNLNQENEVNLYDENTTETDYSALFEEIITNQENISAETEMLNNNISTLNDNVNQSLLHIFYLNGMLLIIILLIMVSRFIIKIF